MIWRIAARALAVVVTFAGGAVGLPASTQATTTITSQTARNALEAVSARRVLADTVRVKLLGRGVPRDAHLRAAVEAVAAVPRHLLVPPKFASQAYVGTILLIGYGQTSTDPEYVAYMTALLRLKRTDRVLEVGTGSGYQAAVLASIVADVRTIEIVAPLAASASANLESLGYANVHVRAGDGYAGWPEYGPFDAIMVTAGAKCLPPALIAQLRPGGRMAIPLGQSIASEKLVIISKLADGSIDANAYDDTMFVDFTGRIERSTPLMRFRRGGIDLKNLRICDA